MSSSYYFACLTCLIIAMTSKPSAAGLILDPSTGFVPVLDQATFDQNSQLIDDQVFASTFSSLPSQFKFFGSTLSQLSISANGSLTDIGGPDSFFTSSFAEGHTTLRIAPLWDDFLFLDPALAPGEPANQILQRVTNDYYAVTWQNIRLHLETNLPSTFTFSQMTTQAILFVAQTTIRGFQFQPNDIAFGYTSQIPATGQFSSLLEAEVGLNQSSGIYSRLALPNDTLLDQTLANALLPWQPNSALLFRPVLDGNGGFLNYNVSTITITAVPEPASTILIGATSCLLLIGRARRRRGHLHMATSNDL